jgi:hypothetical protein
MTSSTGPWPEPPSFQEALADETCPLVLERLETTEPTPVLVCFGGLKGNLVVPPLEFMRNTQSLGVHRVFLRDLNQCWYQKGLPGYGPDVPSAAAALQSIVDSLNPSRRVFIGTSSGAFAATLFGALTGADEVLAFGPQSSIDRVTRRLCHDNRWPEAIAKARRSSVDRRHVNLVRLLSTTPDLGRISVHYGADDRRDAAYARRLANVTEVTVTCHPGDHTFVRQLRDAGELEPLLHDALFRSETH